MHAEYRQHFGQLERQVVYRSDYLLVLFHYLESRMNDKDNKEPIEKSDADVIGLFSSILDQRLVVIDDKEFLGE